MAQLHSATLKLGDVFGSLLLSDVLGWFVGNDRLRHKPSLPVNPLSRSERSREPETSQSFNINCKLRCVLSLGHSGTKTRPHEQRSESAGAQPERQVQTWCREAAPLFQSARACLWRAQAALPCLWAARAAWETVAMSSCSLAQSHSATQSNGANQL